jgi:sugar phosphate isomerase/epimerase
MTRTLSTYLFVKRKLTPGLIAEMARHGVNAVELFLARGHLDYQSGEALREIASALRDHNVAVHSIHAPSARELEPARESGMPLSISEPERVRRQEAVDEIKRALDLVEYIPFGCMVQHLGTPRDAAETRRFDAAFSSLEHLRLFAKERGVCIALENTPGELATPANLRRFLAETRLGDLRLCFDIGHAHLGDGVLPSLETMRELTVTSHIHDNHGLRDEHLPPFEGTIDWPAALAALPPASEVPLVFELKEQPAWADPAPPAVALAAARSAFEKMEQAVAARAEERQE